MSPNLTWSFPIAVLFVFAFVTEDLGPRHFWGLDCCYESHQYKRWNLDEESHGHLCTWKASSGPKRCCEVTVRPPKNLQHLGTIISRTSYQVSKLLSILSTIQREIMRELWRCKSSDTKWYMPYHGHMPLTKQLRSSKLQIWDLQPTCGSMRSSWTFPLVLNQSLPSTGPSVVAIWTAQGRSFKTCWPSEQIVMYIIMLATICLSAIPMWWSI